MNAVASAVGQKGELQAGKEDYTLPADAPVWLQARGGLCSVDRRKE
jgi:hypothetical protein